MVNLDEIEFEKKDFPVVETRRGKDRLPVDILRNYGVFDPNSYKKDKLLNMCKRFIQKYDFTCFLTKVQKLKRKLYLPSFVSSKFTGFH